MMDYNYQTIDAVLNRMNRVDERADIYEFYQGITKTLMDSYINKQIEHLSKNYNQTAKDLAVMFVLEYLTTGVGWNRPWKPDYREVLN